MRIVLYGSRKAILQVEALAIFAVCVSSCIRLEPEWIPREENEKANFISRLVDHDDWKLQQYSKSWTLNGGHTPLIGLLICTTTRCKGSTHDTGTRAQRQWMPLHATGVEKLIGGALHHS